MRRNWIGITAALALIASPLAAHAMDRIAMSQNQPVILGEVIGMNSHSVTVRTPAGASMPIEVDSRTMMASNLPAETRVKVEFKLLDSGLYLAQRITPIERGSHDWDELDNQVAMAQQDDQDNDRDLAQASNNGEDEGTRVASMEGDNDHDAQGDNDHDADDVNKSTTSSTTDNDHSMASNESRTTEAEGSKLPATASPLPLAFVTGLLLLVAAGCLWLARRRAS